MTRLFIGLMFCIAAFSIAMPTLEAKARFGEPWERWLPHDETSMLKIDHGPWERFLLRYLRRGEDGVHRLAYGRVTDASRLTLVTDLERLSNIDIARYNRHEQMAFWLNLYNMLTVKLVLDNYPIASVRDLLDPATGRNGGPWRKKLISVDQVPLSLTDIEDRILKPIWRDPRINYAITCAAIGCPNLQPEPFVGERLEQQLSDAAMAYINDPRCITIENNQLRVSSLYRWNIDDFGGSELEVIHHLMAYAKPSLAMALQGFDRFDGDGFDWRLNDARE